MIKMFRGCYEYLSNFHDCDIQFKGLTFKNSESLFQSLKCINKSDKELFCNLKGYEAKSLGRKIKLRPDWERIKIAAMYVAIREKFNQNEDLKLLLLSTRDEYIQEGNCWGDTFWGTVNGRGKNYLGKLLMKLRSEYLEEINNNENNI